MTEHTDTVAVEPMPFRKKPVEIDAVRFIGIQDGLPAFDVPLARDVPDWISDALKLGMDSNGGIWPYAWGGVTLDSLVIGTLEGDHIARGGDWIIRGVQGELYPCKPDIFAATYETTSTPKAERDGVLEEAQTADAPSYPNLAERMTWAAGWNAARAQMLRSTPSDAVLDREAVALEATRGFVREWHSKSGYGYQIIWDGKEQRVFYPALDDAYRALRYMRADEILALRATPSPSGEVERLREALEQADYAAHLGLEKGMNDGAVHWRDGLSEVQRIARTALDTGNLSDEGVR